MNGLMLHQGGIEVSLADLQAVPLPEKTPTYQPVAHADLAMNLQRVASDLLTDYEFDHSSYGLNKEGQQLFGIHTFRNGSEDMGMSIGFRNSYDKSMSVGIAIGASVFVCDNLALTGEVTIMKKHTLNVLAELEEKIVTTIYRSKNNFTNIVEDARKMGLTELDDDMAYRIMGLLYGHKVISPTQLSVMNRGWQDPVHEQFEPRNLWSLYNCANSALKSSPHNKIMEKHIALHKILTPMSGAELLIERDVPPES
ncbi:MAG: hypothetical protein H8D23_29255 [Candidatus Brocadiales bacterium]|nr:hypothetical protein [Candidatus Brocadiales bacterium]